MFQNRSEGGNELLEFVVKPPIIIYKSDSSKKYMEFRWHEDVKVMNSGFKNVWRARGEQALIRDHQRGIDDSYKYFGFFYRDQTDRHERRVGEIKRTHLGRRGSSAPIDFETSWHLPCRTLWSWLALRSRDRRALWRVAMYGIGDAENNKTQSSGTNVRNSICVNKMILKCNDILEKRNWWFTWNLGVCVAFFPCVVKKRRKRGIKKPVRHDAVNWGTFHAGKASMGRGFPPRHQPTAS